ncbi:fumarylacetoacetate hydrolase family protein [Gilvimarinus sp. F26214L]|uniref:fumarylacetoacetate hydrolase family protein n=1 Tax=Gilvimarinus sp. DZF01 TaxID=3461371 RepID=UPI00404572C1
MRYVFDPPVRPSVGVQGLEARFPVHRIYCVGRNYAAHAREMGQDPERDPPFFFTKPADAIVTDYHSAPYPPKCADLHHEVELVVAIGRGGQDIAVESAEQHIYGYGVGVDLTRRDLQTAARKKGQPWDASKGFDSSAPVSRITPVEVCGHLRTGTIALAVNGETRQKADIGDLIWSVPEVIAQLSGLFQLQPGDLIFTGTPAGVAALKPGDRVEARIDGLQDLRVTIS